MSKNIVLMGTAPSSMNLAPFNNPEWEIWSCSPGTQLVPRTDKFFELHRWEPAQEWFSPAYMEFLAKYEGEVIMTAPNPAVPNCKVLEWERLVKKFGPYNFTSSLAWMCAMAIEEEPDKIAFYGVDMAATSEYHDQRMGLHAFAQIAAYMGIEVGCPPESDLLRPPPLYGVCEQSHAWIKETVRARELAGRLRQLEATVAQSNQEAQFIRGAMDDQDWHLHSFIGNIDSINTTFTQPYVPDILMIPTDDEKTAWKKDEETRRKDPKDPIEDTDPIKDTRPYRQTEE